MDGDDFPGTARFAIRRPLGRGGMGVVYEAWDRERAATVALKTLRAADATRIFTFKHEFRALADVSHPNLATLHELVRAGEVWFYTMELVAGRDFLTWVRPEQRLDVERLRAAIEQLGEGIAALHQAGKLHRDLKPPNVLITDEGRVVVLDFGLVSELAPRSGAHGGGPNVWGTPAYMAPEQAAGETLTAAADWYSFGVMLYQALTGQLPFRGAERETMKARLRVEPPPPREIAPDVPPDLDALAVDLLRRDPALRPSGPEVLRRVGSVTAQRVGVLAPATLPAAGLAGREKHLAELSRALAAVRGGRTVSVIVEGASGMGKSALVRHFLDDLERRHEGLVLAGRCYERENVPYKAIDSLIDSLVSHLLVLPRFEVDELLPRDVVALARVFPVLNRHEAVVERPRPLTDAPDRREQRRIAFAALRELLSRLADSTTLVLFIDDLQWADSDSASLLGELLRGPSPPPLLLLCAWRDDDAASSTALRSLAAGDVGLGPDVRRIQVDALRHDEAVRLARALLEDGVADAVARAQEIASESRGHPYLVAELCRHTRAHGATPGGGLSLDAVLEARARRFPAEARRLLEAVCVAAHPVPQAVACRAAGLRRDDLVPLAMLRAGHLVRTRGPRDVDLIEPYHDRIREAVTRALDAERVRELHYRIAVSLEVSGVAEPGALALHFRAAGVRDRAAEWALKAAARAETALAFGGAASFYRAGVEETGASADPAAARALQRKLGEALANAGRGRDAAEVFLAGAKGAPERERLELMRLAAEQFLQSGHIDDGLAVINSVLRAIGSRLPGTPARALRSLVVGRVRLRLRGMRFTLRDAGAIPPDELSLVNLHWSLASALGLIDTVRGADFQTRHLLVALRTGEPFRIVRALSAEIAYQAVAGAGGRRRAVELIALADELRARVDDPQGLRLITWATGVHAFMSGRFAEALDRFERAEVLLRETVAASWELDLVHAFRLWSMFYAGALAEIVERVPTWLGDARERGDRFAINMMSSGWANLAWLCVEDVEGARRVVDAAISGWAFAGFHLQHYLELLARGGIDLYAGDGEAAWARIEARWPALEASMQLHVQHNRIEMRFLRARSALAAGRLEVAEQDARALDREDLDWPRGLAALCHAGVRDARGDRAGAATGFEQAAACFERDRLPMHELVARRRLGETRGGEAGARLVAQVDQLLTAQKVRDPARFCAIWAPLPGGGAR